MSKAKVDRAQALRRPGGRPPGGDAQLYATEPAQPPAQLPSGVAAASLRGDSGYAPAQQHDRSAAPEAAAASIEEGGVDPSVASDHGSRSGEVGSPAAPLAVSQLPHLVRTPAGEVLGGFTVDYYAYLGHCLILSGWVVGDANREALERKGDQTRLSVRLFVRPDVELAFPALATSARGLLAVVRLGDDDDFELCGQWLQAPPRATGAGDLPRLLLDHKARLGFLLQSLQDSGASLASLVAQLETVPAAYQRARGYIEQAKGVPEHGGLVVGWTVHLPGVQLALVDQHGKLVSLSEAMRWHRPDIVEAFGNEFGNFSFNAGLLQCWLGTLTLGEEVRLCAFDGAECHVLASRRWEAAPVEPVSFARWAFEFPTPLDRFTERLERHDGALISELIAAKLAARPATQPEIQIFGPQLEQPRCSIIIPLYGRFDFMLNQLLEFSEDEQLKADAELIYVVDDPRILSEVRQQAPLLYEANRVPFRVVSVGENRGFSGANNLGVSVSRAPYLLLLNSDVIAVEPGWLQKMLAAIEDRPEVGIVGARLFYPSGAIQHDGMAFDWNADLQAHINKHPGMGLEPPPPRVGASPRLAVTGACMLIARELYQRLGGLDEGFLVGDFEDSDLCLKVRDAGLSIVCIEDVNLVHLERQSLTGIGQDRFRNFVVRYNAWRHENRWGDELRRIAAGGAGR